MTDDATRQPRPATPPPTLPVVDYSTPPPINRNARRAVLWAALSFLPFIPGILAIRFGRRGARDAADEPPLGGRVAARAATVIGAVSVVVWTMLAILAVPATIQARRQSQRVHCMSQLRQIGLAVQIYAVNNQGNLPPSLDTLVTSRILPAPMFTCPACAGDPAKPVASTGAFGSYHYAYVGSGQRMQAIGNAATTPLVYELPTNHADPGINILYADGHVELLKGPGVATLLQQMAATTQPATTAPAAPELER